MASAPWQGELFKHAPGAQGRLAFRPVNSARRSREEARSVASGLLPLAALFIVIALGFVWMRIRYTEIAYRQATLREVVVQLESEHRDLASAVAAAESPAQLEQAARGLGMVPPTLVNERPLR
jgi:hypothetical protein